MKEYRTIDKSGWPRGEWDQEPDKAQWKDPATGLHCLIVRNSMGALCGYVGVPASHPLHGVGYDEVSIDARVHGGLTYSDRCDPRGEEDPGSHICHVPEPGDPDDVWWFGFDCSHYGDYMPAPGYAMLNSGRYRNVEYVRGEIADLALALRAAGER